MNLEHQVAAILRVYIVVEIEVFENFDVRDDVRWREVFDAESDVELMTNLFKNLVRVVPGDFGEARTRPQLRRQSGCGNPGDASLRDKDGVFFEESSRAIENHGSALGAANGFKDLRHAHVGFFR